MKGGGGLKDELRILKNVRILFAHNYYKLYILMYFSYFHLYLVWFSFGCMVLNCS
jgi:hypothetical protein